MARATSNRPRLLTEPLADAVFAAAVTGVVGLLAGVWAGAALAARLTGRHLRAGLAASRVALALARQRIMGSRYPYFLLADPQGDVRKGFIYVKIPRVSQNL